MSIQTAAVSLLTANDRMELFVRGECCAAYRYADGQMPGFLRLSAPGDRDVTQPNADGLGLWLWHSNTAADKKKQKDKETEDSTLSTCHSSLATSVVTEDMTARRGTYSVGFQHECAWLDADGIPLLRDTRTVRIASGPSEGSILDIALRLQAPDDRTVTLGRTNDSLLCLRAAPALFESGADWSGGGHARNSLGEYGMTNLHGRQAQWCGCAGVVRGETVGFAFLEHPDNPFFPSSWIAREDGTLSPSPFAWRSLTLAPGERLNLRYRLLIYMGYVNQGWADARLEDFARES